MTTFATDLDQLIGTHVGTTKCGDDLLPIIEALYEAANRMARQADHYRWCDAFENSGQKHVLCREAKAPTQKPRKLVVDFEAMLRRREQVKDQRKRNQRRHSTSACPHDLGLLLMKRERS